MNSQKVEQTIKRILEDKGEAILQNRSAFRSATVDLLDDIHYPEERLVLKHAMDANAFWTLLGSDSFTTDGAKKAAEQLAKESHMRDKDAEFVVQCVAAARGVNLEAPKPESSEPPKPEEPEPPKPELPASADFEADCSLKTNGKKQSGKVYLYQNKLTFIPDSRNGKTTEILYNDIKELLLFKKQLYGAGFVILFIVLVCMSAGVYLDIGGAILLGVAIWYYLNVRRRISIKRKQDRKECYLFIMKKCDAKKQMLYFLQKQL